MLLGSDAELPAQRDRDLLDPASECGGQALGRGDDFRRGFLHQLDRLAPRGLLLLGCVAASVLPPLERLPGAAQYRALIFEYLPDRANKSFLIASHLLRPRLAGLVQGLPELARHGAQLGRRGIQQFGHRRNPHGGGSQTVDAPLQAGRRLGHRLRLRRSRLAHVLDAPVQLRERFREAAHGFAKRLAQLVAHRVREPLLRRVLVAAGLKRLPEVVQRPFESAVGAPKQPERDQEVVQHAGETGPESRREGRQHLQLEGGQPPQPDREGEHGAPDADDEGPPSPIPACGRPGARAPGRPSSM